MGLFSFIGDALNDILGGNSSRRDSQRYNLQNMAVQQQYQRQNMADQNYYNVQAFNRENAYNSPSAVVGRTMAAGVNPMWTDGPGSAIAQQDSGVSPVAPSGGMPSGSNIDIIGSLSQLLGLKSQIKVNKSIEDLNEAKANEINKKLPEGIKNLGASTENLQANTKALLAQAFKTEKEASYYFMDLEKKWENWSAQNENLLTQVSRIRELLPHEVEKMDADKEQALMAAALSKILSEYKPKEVAIEQQKADTGTFQAQTDRARQREEIRHNLKVEANETFHNLTERINANENIRNNKTLNSLQRALNNSVIKLNNSSSKYYDSQSGKVDAEKYYQDMYNETYSELNKAGVNYELVNSMMWKMKADKQKIMTEIEKMGQEIEYFNDAYFGKLMKDYLPIPFLK